MRGDAAMSLGAATLGTATTAPRWLFDPVRIEAPNSRADDRRRVVDITPEEIAIRRRVAGVPMAIRVKPRAYLGVALTIAGFCDGRFQYQLLLVHPDPGLSVTLGEGEDRAAVEADWRLWVGRLRLPALAGRTEGAYMPVRLAADAPCPPHARRRGGALKSRRPQFSRRRTLGAPLLEAPGGSVRLN